METPTKPNLNASRILATFKKGTSCLEKRAEDEVKREVGLEMPTEDIVLYEKKKREHRKR
jgi:hypothetical protein